MREVTVVEHWRAPTGQVIAYQRVDGRSPTIVFLGGYRSDMTGTKATFLDRWCRQNGYAYLRFDYSGHGASSGAFKDATLGQWIAESRAVIEANSDGPVVLVGSSMGGWIMLHVALALKNQVVGLVGVAAAPDFTRDLLSRGFTPEQRATLQRVGEVMLASVYDDTGYPVTREFIDDAEQHLVLDSTIDIHCPVKLLQGMSDSEVPWQTAVRLASALATDQVQLHLTKSGDHRLSSDTELRRMASFLTELLDEVSKAVRADD
ncbi:MAG: alpha/beta hydrolase [Pseudomonadota bacterium]|nr:alpha/beta hydrolase [Pseudomonadota bacterium]